MTVLERVRNFIVDQRGRATCDDCIAKHLDLSVRQHANHKTRELGAARGFSRSRGHCAVCKSSKLVIRTA